MRQLSRLRTLRTLANKEDDDQKLEEANRDHAAVTRPAILSGKVNNSGDGGSGGSGDRTVEVPPGSSNNADIRPTKRSLFLEHENEDDERGCMEAVSAFLVAISTAYHAADNKHDSKGAAVGTAVATEGASPALLQTSKGAGTVECRDSARELLRFFGHAPLLHLEGVIWVKTPGERGDDVRTAVILRIWGLNSSAAGCYCSKSLFGKKLLRLPLSLLLSAVTYPRNVGTHCCSSTAVEGFWYPDTHLLYSVHRYSSRDPLHQCMALSHNTPLPLTRLTTTMTPSLFRDLLVS